MFCFSTKSNLKLFRKNQNGFRRKRSITSQESDNPSNYRSRLRKTPEAKLLLADFSKVFVFILRGKMKQIPQAYSLSKEIFTGIMILYISTKAMVCSPEHRTWIIDLFDIVGRTKRYIRTIFVYNLSKLHILKVDRSNERKWFT